MSRTDRNRILDALCKAPQASPMPDPATTDSKPAPLDREALANAFMEKIRPEADLALRITDDASLLRELTTIAGRYNLKTVMVADNPLLLRLDLPDWGRCCAITIVQPSGLPDRNRYIDAVFCADAGITAVDYAVAETGSLVLAHNRHNPRLLSHAPPLHIAVVPVDRIVQFPEEVTDALYAKNARPAHLCWISGPSSSGDIQGTLFRGMHGPQGIVVLVYG